tara:strand:- start:2980 stop:3612 length:633 start_codon:yes stop_codon:yes gene_type:complete
MNLIVENWRKYLKEASESPPNKAFMARHKAQQDHIQRDAQQRRRRRTTKDAQKNATDDDRKYARLFFGADSSAAQIIYLAQDLDPGMAIDNIIKWTKAARELVNIGLFSPIDGESEEDANRHDNKKKATRLKSLKDEMLQATDVLVAVLASRLRFSDGEGHAEKLEKTLKIQGMVEGAHDAALRATTESAAEEDPFVGQSFENLRLRVAD